MKDIILIAEWVGIFMLNVVFGVVVYYAVFSPMGGL